MEHIALAAKFLAAGLCAFSMKAAAEGVSKIWITLIETVGRNPTVKKDVNAFGLIGFAATEAIALYALVIALIMLFVG
ncbi:MAG: ATP synthase subunit C family protein [Alphaproteobacteria bacterium]|nr:ATP synthase subunit C family protein [Alphaproteobacteria bacterium]